MPSNGLRRPLPLTVTSTSKATGAAAAPVPWVRRSNDPEGGLLFRIGSSSNHHQHHHHNKSPATPQGRDWGGGDDAQVKPITNYYRRGSGGQQQQRRYTNNYVADDDDDDVMEHSPPRSVDERLAQIRLANSQVFHNDAFRPMQEDIILGALAGQGFFVLMPTGSGKREASHTRG